ncbi:2-oxo acid dehydrogenase subunit E2 [Alicyclobacillus cycloheptanicus]|uniref:Dihydrolipoamide acetyltransferase component of pyruvate dehydrogenase complex n=1 Tax=Alicyclobacillus cycloheptanicus TaxID=1457 RepID=A0ABT9XNC9_9BACL|nr:dihydrolipoamide acetyltransferase family protein [Alicyclobacillus cycloheptanicus]MDQ0191206.1 pyruvate dehydrogenase E2 component (dihydrolipoamide acetyltransferase) [Alicyclobacillus cycloheptanicus]WDM02119.1 2-oxo acid dehydrogenase subunit E2 [Alicyclobacillus cycloheptanicus]
MAEPVTMPKLAMTQESGTILQWFKTEGETVRVGEPLLEVMTNKVNIEVESYTEGVLLKRLYEAGTEVPVLDVIAYIGEAGEPVPTNEAAPLPSGGENAAVPSASDTSAANARPSSNEPGARDAASDAGQKVRATPAARALARAHGVPLQQIQGSGHLGRIHREDVQAYLEQRIALENASPAQRRSKPRATADAPEAKAARQVTADTDDQTVVPLTGMRRVIGQRMAESAFQAPHVTLCLEVDMRAASELRTQLIPLVEAETGTRLSMNTLILKTVARVLRKHPNVNATWAQENALVQHRSVNLGMAVSVPGGLLVPVIPGADRLGLGELAAKASELADRARAQKLSPDDLQGGTFTVSNLGMFGIEEFTPIINQPQVAILGVGSMIEKPTVHNGQVVIGPQMKLSLSFDHRALDGAEAAMFLRDVKQSLESPMSLLL